MVIACSTYVIVYLLRNSMVNFKNIFFYYVHTRHVVYKF